MSDYTELILDTYKHLDYSNYPNPADDIVHLDLRENLPGTYQYNIYNQYGESLKSGSASNEVIQLNISQFTPNIYFVHVSNGELTTVKNLMVQ